MLNVGVDNSFMLPQEFGLNNVGRDSENEIFELFLEENNFDQFTFRFSNALNELLVYENEDNNEMESYLGEYDHDIEIELGQNNNSNNNDNELVEEKDEIIPDEFGTNE